MIMNCFCGMVGRRKAFSLISSRDHCQRSSPSWISDTPRAGFEPAQNPSSDFVEWSCAVVITTIPRQKSWKRTCAGFNPVTPLHFYLKNFLTSGEIHLVWGPFDCPALYVKKYILTIIQSYDVCHYLFINQLFIYHITYNIFKFWEFLQQVYLWHMSMNYNNWQSI